MCHIEKAFKDLIMMFYNKGISASIYSYMYGLFNETIQKQQYKIYIKIQYSYIEQIKDYKMILSIYYAFSPSDNSQITQTIFFIQIQKKPQVKSLFL